MHAFVDPSRTMYVLFLPVSGLRMNDTDAYPNSYSVEFSDLASPDDESLSTEMTINFNDDLLSEPTECFICLILRPFATRGIHVKDPDTLTVCIKDNDGEFCS